MLILHIKINKTDSKLLLMFLNQMPPLSIKDCLFAFRLRVMNSNQIFIP